MARREIVSETGNPGMRTSGVNVPLRFTVTYETV